MSKIFAVVLSALLLLTGCASGTATTTIEMELTDSYDTAAPFVQEKLFYVSDKIDTVKLTVLF